MVPVTAFPGSGPSPVTSHTVKNLLGGFGGGFFSQSWISWVLLANAVASVFLRRAQVVRARVRPHVAAAGLPACIAGLWGTFGGSHAAHSRFEAVLALGSGTLLWMTGLLGVAEAVGHYKWVLGTLGNSPTDSPVH